MAMYSDAHSEHHKCSEWMKMMNVNEHNALTPLIWADAEPVGLQHASWGNQSFKSLPSNTFGFALYLRWRQ